MGTGLSVAYDAAAASAAASCALVFGAGAGGVGAGAGGTGAAATAAQRTKNVPLVTVSVSLISGSRLQAAGSSGASAGHFFACCLQNVARSFFAVTALPLVASLSVNDDASPRSKHKRTSSIGDDGAATSGQLAGIADFFCRISI